MDEAPGQSFCEGKSEEFFMYILEEKYKREMTR